MAEKKKKWVSKEKAEAALKKPEPAPRKKSGAELLYGGKPKEKE